MEMDHRDSDLEGSVCSPDYVGGRRLYDTSVRSGTELSEPDEDSDDAIPRISSAATPPILNNTPVTPDHDIVSKIKREREDRDREDVVKVSQGVTSMVPPPFSLPLPFPFPPPGAFLPPAPAYPAPPPAPQPGLPPSSGSSHSSESSSSSQQTWSFEEQFKQVRQLYEISDDPKRKEFLDDLFSFMQRRGTPINRLPIMAKSVLDLYELYNLVIQRGGLVDVINKKLWQEIIKGLHLPSSITSAAFTLRTQYMKYLYPYECEKRRLSTPVELQAAIDGNRREGRRGSYGTYAEMMQRSPTQMSPLSLVTVTRPQMNGSNSHSNNNHLHPHQSMMPPNLTGPIPGMVPPEFEARMVEYVKLLNKELRSSSATPPNHRQNSPPGSPHEPGAEMSRLSLWNMYHGQGSPPLPATTPTPEPQREPINLEKREALGGTPGPPPAKRPVGDQDEPKVSGTHIKISSRGDGRTGMDSSLVVSMDINGTMYQGVLFAQTTHNNNNNNNSSSVRHHQT